MEQELGGFVRPQSYSSCKQRVGKIQQLEMRNPCLARRAVNHCLQSWQMLCHAGSLNRHAGSLSLDPVQAEITLAGGRYQ